MQQMGKISSPLTGEIERDLDQARGSIDMLDMLRRKTTGNLSPEEQELLDHVLYELRMNYVDEQARENTGDKESGESSSDSSEPGVASDATSPDPDKP